MYGDKQCRVQSVQLYQLCTVYTYEAYIVLRRTDYLAHSKPIQLMFAHTKFLVLKLTSTHFDDATCCTN